MSVPLRYLPRRNDNEVIMFDTSRAGYLAMLGRDRDGSAASGCHSDWLSEFTLAKCPLHPDSGEDLLLHRRGPFQVPDQMVCIAGCSTVDVIRSFHDQGVPFYSVAFAGFDAYDDEEWLRRFEEGPS